MGSNNRSNPVPKIILAAAVFVTVLLAFLLFVHWNNQMKWSPVSGLSGERREHYAKLSLMPEFAPHIDNVFIRGLRDPDYKIESRSYPTVEELYAILPFKDKESSAEALEALLKAEIDPPEKSDLGNVSKVYRADILPLTLTGEDGKKLLETYYSHEYYVVSDDGGYRFVFIVHIM